MNAPTNKQQGARSNFVSIMAWIFIVLAGFSTLISILQNIMINTIFPFDEIQTRILSKGPENIPGIALFMMKNVRWFFLAFLIVSAITFVSAIGLLKRKNWARIIFIGLMGSGILWNIGGIVFQWIFMSSMPAITADAPADFKSQFETMRTVIVVFSALMTLGFSILFGWIIKKLISQPIRTEFS